MIPRYVPDVHFGAWCSWLLGEKKQADIKTDFFKLIDPYGWHENKSHVYLFENARQGLYAYFQEVKRKLHGGKVLISAQICPVVPLMMKDLGFAVRFVDIDASYPAPSPQQFLDALDKETVGVIVAPLYGCLQKEWAGLFEKLRGVPVVLDMAQGLLLDDEAYAELFQKSNAVVFSFGLGKGLDAGGGLLLSDAALDVSRFGCIKKSGFMKIFFQSMVLRCVLAAGMYRLIVRQLDEAVAADKKPARMDSVHVRLAPEDMVLLWKTKLCSYAGDVLRARKRAQVLKDMPVVQEHCKDIYVFCDESAVFLRQVLRFKDAVKRDSVLQKLRKRGVDCLAAGEPLPCEYFTGCENMDFENARAFKEQSIRLPFLGRLTEKQFAQLKLHLDDILAKHLSH